MRTLTALRGLTIALNAAAATGFFYSGKLVPGFMFVVVTVIWIGILINAEGNR